MSPSAKYTNDTPTPPLKLNQFTRNNNAYRPRRKFSILRDKFEATRSVTSGSTTSSSTTTASARPMILAKSNNDLYQNISDDFLMVRQNSLGRSEAQKNQVMAQIAKCKSVPNVVAQPMPSSTASEGGHCFSMSSKFELRPDEKYDGSSLERNRWSTASYQRPMALNHANILRNNSKITSYNSRNSNARRSMSILDERNKENCVPLPPKPKNFSNPNSGLTRPRASHRNVELLKNGSPKNVHRRSLSPNSRIFQKASPR